SRDVRTVRVRTTRIGEPWFVDDDSDLWRAYEFVDGRVAQPRSMLARRDVAFAFGAFARGLGDLDAKEFELPIPRFHDFDHRVRRFERAVLDERAGRARLERSRRRMAASTRSRRAQRRPDCRRRALHRTRRALRHRSPRG